MATQIWHYLENQFDNATKINFKLMNIINADHFAKLQAQQSDPDIAALLARTTAPHDNFNHAYSIWFSIKGIHKGETDRVDNYIHELSSTKIKQWDIAIQQVYLEGSSDYISILPNRRKPFQQGGTDARISQLDALGQRLAAYPALAATMNDVIAFHTTLNDARDVQQQKEGLLNNASDLTETARKEIATMMYKNLGALMDKYAGNLNLVSNFWELSLLSSGSGAVVAPPAPAPPPPAAASITMLSNQTIPGMVTLDLTGNSFATGTQQLTAAWDPGIFNTSVPADGIHSVFQWTYTAAGTKTIDLTGDIITIGAMNISNNKLTSYTPTGGNKVSNFNASNNALDLDSIHRIIIWLDGNGISNGTLHLEGGTNVAPVVGFPALASLIAKGWTVMTN